jgi:hypothetical protein
MKPTLLGLLAFGAAQILGNTSYGQTLVLDMKGDNYSVQTTGIVGGTWTDASASSNDATSVTYYLSPGVATAATPSGSNAVNFAYNGYFNSADTSNSKPLALESPLTSASFTSTPSFTMAVVAFLPSGYSTSLFFGGSATGNLSYRINADGTQTLTAAASADVGTSTGTAYTAGEWAVFAVTYAANSYAFYLNGEQVGSGTRTLAFTTPTSSRIASNYAGNTFTGQIAALQIYDGGMTSTQVGALSESLNNLYLVPEPSVTMLGGLGVLAMAFLRRRKS